MIKYGPVCNAFEAGSIHYEGKWEGGWAREIETFLGPVKWHRAYVSVGRVAYKCSEDSILGKSNPVMGNKGFEIIIL
jgi:hypothetical protein